MKILHNFGFLDEVISITDILSILSENKIQFDEAYLSLQYDGNHDENPSVILYID